MSDESTERNHCFCLGLVSSVVVVVHIMAMNGYELLDRDKNKMSLEKSGVESASISSTIQYAVLGSFPHSQFVSNGFMGQFLMIGEFYYALLVN